MITASQHDSVRVLRLEAPPSNVLSLALLAELREKARAAQADAAVRCLVLVSAFPRYFSTGLDLRELTGLPPARQAEPFHSLLETYRLIRTLSIPTLAAIDGSAILGGWILAMSCDFRLATPDSKIALSEIRFGMSPTSALVARVSELAARPSLVKDLVLRGKTLRAQEALEGGFLDRLVAPEALREEALKEARSLGKMAPSAYASIKQALTGRSPQEEEALWQRSREEFSALFSTAEAKEGIEAMRDKRRPRWDQ